MERVRPRNALADAALASNELGRPRNMPREMAFIQCERGYVLRAGPEGMVPQMWAFRNVGELAAFLIENYPDPDDEDDL